MRWAIRASLGWQAEACPTKDVRAALGCTRRSLMPQGSDGRAAMRLGEVRDFGGEAHIRCGCPARVVDDVRDLAVGADAYRDQVMELDVGVVGRFDGPAQHDALVRSEERRVGKERR